MLFIIALLLGAYLLGSLSSAIIVCKVMGLPDPRSTGSGNPGATNVLRIAGKKAAFITLLGDALKGFLPVAIARLLSTDNTVLALVMFSAFWGHLFPVFFHFKGGKGVATTMGGLWALSWQLAGLWSITWLIVLIIFRYSSLSAIIATVLLPFYAGFILQHNAMVMLILSVMGLLLLYRHKDNIARLRLGTEKRIHFFGRGSK
jgi:acyl phosphate:glycerol-3-phosphate acyltransferase